MRWSTPSARADVDTEPHMLLPEEVANTCFMLGFFFIHLGFPIVLGITYPWWQGRAGELVTLIVLNHVVTFAGLGGLASAM